MAIIENIRNIEVTPRFPIDDVIAPIFKECTPRILVVADGNLSFGSSDFGLSDFISTLESTVIHGMIPIVKTAHRGATSADFSNFTFTNSTLSKNHYDVLFLFGYSSAGSLATEEISVIEQFMNDGGGVFATGDHATLGKQLCGNIPRIRQMRRWIGPSASGTDRISTNDPGSSNTFSFGDQSDTIPQKIYPAYTGTPASSSPHALLQHPAKNIIEVLPDHPHESECTIPSSSQLNNADEWPKDSTGTTVSPEIVALSMSYGGGFTTFNKQPISAPRAFGAIAAYDGHQAGVGRISTDATWHHFINVNLVSSSAGPGLIGNADAYDRVSTYFGNIANWLMPKRVRRCLRWPLILTIKRLYPVAEFLPDIQEKGANLESFLEIGRETRNTLSRFMGPAQQQEIVDDLLELHSEELAGKVANLRKSPASLEESIEKSLAPAGFIHQIVLGALAIAAETAVPSDSDPASGIKKAGGIEGLDRVASEAVREALTMLSEILKKGRNSFDALLESF